jgi:hypothetical protein
MRDPPSLKHTGVSVFQLEPALQTAYGYTNTSQLKLQGIGTIKKLIRLTIFPLNQHVCASEAQRTKQKMYNVLEARCLGYCINGVLDCSVRLLR